MMDDGVAKKMDEEVGMSLSRAGKQKKEVQRQRQRSRTGFMGGTA